MLPLDEHDRYERAWKAWRHRLWALSAVLLGLAWALSESSDDILPATLCLAGIAAALFWFCRFPCPRCGELFVTWRSIAGQMRARQVRCRHCDLAAREIPRERSY
jgi:predicted RNA-binding Zn-ribbon protein involved in translation (DUF1610 family)